MSGFKDIAKGGWHPKAKDGKSKESWRGDNKGINTVAGWMGKGKNPTAEGLDHVSRPLTTLKDPSAFGPPPKNVNYHGGAALPNQITPDTRGLGAPLSRDEIATKQLAEEAEKQREEEEAARPKPPPVPYRKDTTGLSTAHLPPPPGRKDGADGRAPPEVSEAKPPGLPPRLPPRQNSSPMNSPPPYNSTATPEPESHRVFLNQNSLNNLSAAGVSIPDIGIGGSKGRQPLPPPISRPSNQDVLPSQPEIPPTNNSSQLNELQSRFSRLSTKSPSQEAPSEGTTFAQKQAALKTASSFRNDPSSVSLSDAKTATSTANNFRERHGEQVRSSWQSANKLNTKYGIADKIGGMKTTALLPPSVNTPPPELEYASQPSHFNGGSQTALTAKKKPPPPPPMKKPKLGSYTPANGPGVPPPIPLSSKPKPAPTSSTHRTTPPPPRDLDLDLQSLWFASSPPAFPPPTISHSRLTHATTSGWSSNGVRKTHTFSAVVQDNGTLARTNIHLTWDASNPGLTVKAQQRHTPPPPALSRYELDDCRQRYSERVASWSESMKGRQVGDGECWTLANEALKAVALTYHNPSRSAQEAGVARGDVLQILAAVFKSKDGLRTSWAGDPDHTAVVTGIAHDGKLSVVESNVGGVKKVQVGSYDLSEMTKGEVRIFRAVGESWAGPMDPNW
ncbi:putative altered inheritance of mitochondria protein 3 [Amylocarpus encephaloides]|uniref:Altered inheritance of mitochondria protein 3 n=1 Tax=Amylocarpus encephaloides TaxID=45428 RepID=A0A9P8C3R0_9HELO|nr:putative altered inheritance of mitochondria protein 3 [Amylocarpus encephaloides]